MRAVNSLPKLSSVDGQLILNDLYETEYGIYDHLAKNKKRPLASVAMQPSEDINDGSILEETLRTYVLKGIKDVFHLDVLEFLELPPDIVQMMFSIAGDEQTKKSAMLSQVEQQFKV